MSLSERALVGDKLTEWYNLVAVHINLNEGWIFFMWNLHKSGAFTVKSMYRHLVNNGLKATQKIAYGNSKIIFLCGILKGK